MSTKAITDYLQAGLDESLANFVKGVFASAIVAAVGYAGKHAINFNPTTVEAVVYMGLASPALVHVWNWLKTTANTTKVVTTTVVGTPVSTNEVLPAGPADAQ